MIAEFKDPTLFSAGDPIEKEPNRPFCCPLNGGLLDDVDYVLKVSNPDISEEERITLLESIGYERTGVYR